MFYHFVFLPVVGVLLLGAVVWIARAAARVPARSITDPPLRVPLIVGGWAFVAVGVVLLGLTGINAYSLASIKTEAVEGEVRRGMREEHGVEPQNLHLSPDGWGRYKGTAELNGTRLDVAAELGVVWGGAKVTWEHKPTGGH